MVAPMGRTVAVAAVMAVLALPASATAQEGAPAQTAPPVVGNFGGGAVVAPPASPFSAGNMVIGLRAGGGPQVRITATIVAACASGTFDTLATVAADGTFSAAGSSRQSNTRASSAIIGTLSASPSGTATAHFKRTINDRTRRCGAEGVQWQARRALGGFGDAGAVVPDALLLGTTGQRERGARRGIALQVSSDGTTLRRAIYGLTLRCDGDTRSVTYDLPADDLAIGADGRVSSREAGKRRTKTAIFSYVERFGATLGSTGAEGFFSAKLTIRRRSTGRRISTCRSGVVRFSAAP
jgi:hypothetical protein